jgi:hypothetical protein
MRGQTRPEVSLQEEYYQALRGLGNARNVSIPLVNGVLLRLRRLLQD